MADPSISTIETRPTTNGTLEFQLFQYKASILEILLLLLLSVIYALASSYGAGSDPIVSL